MQVFDMLKKINAFNTCKVIMLNPGFLPPYDTHDINNQVVIN